MPKPLSSLTILLISGLFLCIVSTTHGDDWPMLGRDMTRNPVSLEKNPPTSWQVEKKLKNIKWSANLGRFSHASPVVASGLVWVGTRHPSSKGRLGRLLCYREKDGKLLDHYDLQAAKGTEWDWNWSGHSSAPLVKGDRAWFTTIASEVVCLDIAGLRCAKGSAKVVWKLDMKKQLGILPTDAPMSYGKKCSIASYKNYLYVLTGNGVTQRGDKLPPPKAPSLVCLEKKTGRVVWQDNSPKSKDKGAVPWLSKLRDADR